MESKLFIFGTALSAVGVALSAWGLKLNNEKFLYAGAAVQTLAVGLLGTNLLLSIIKRK